MDWAEIGGAPYLNDSDGNWIETATLGQIEDNFTFADLPAYFTDADVGGVVIQCESHGYYGFGRHVYDVYIDHGTGWNLAGRSQTKGR